MDAWEYQALSVIVISQLGSLKEGEDLLPIYQWVFSDDSSVLVVRSQPTDYWVNFGGRWLIAAAMRRLTDPLKCQATVGGGLMMRVRRLRIPSVAQESSSRGLMHVLDTTHK